MVSPGGEIGRRKGLKIPRWQHRAGSSPAPGTLEIYSSSKSPSSSPSSSKSKHLYILSNFSRLLKNKHIATQLRGCENSDSLFAVLLNFNLSSAA